MKEELTNTYLNVNEFEDEIYFSKEKFEDLSLLLFILISRNYFILLLNKKYSKSEFNKEYMRFIKKIFGLKIFLDRQATISKYHFNKLCENWGLEED